MTRAQGDNKHFYLICSTKPTNWTWADQCAKCMLSSKPRTISRPRSVEERLLTCSLILTNKRLYSLTPKIPFLIEHVIILFSDAWRWIGVKTSFVPAKCCRGARENLSAEFPNEPVDSDSAIDMHLQRRLGRGTIKKCNNAAPLCMTTIIIDLRSPPILPATCSRKQIVRKQMCSSGSEVRQAARCQKSFRTSFAQLCIGLSGPIRALWTFRCCANFHSLAFGRQSKVPALKRKQYFELAALSDDPTQ